jgi:hypothetical protein
VLSHPTSLIPLCLPYPISRKKRKRKLSNVPHFIPSFQIGEPLIRGDEESEEQWGEEGCNNEHIESSKVDLHHPELSLL